MYAQPTEKKSKNSSHYLALIGPNFLCGSAVRTRSRTFMNFFAASTAPNHTCHFHYLYPDSQSDEVEGRADSGAPPMCA